MATGIHRNSKSRVTIVERVIELKGGNGDRDGDLHIWKWLLELLQWYQSDGMSSEDTDTDNIGTTYRVKILVWCRNVNKYFHMINNERKLWADIFPMSGAKPTACHCSSTNTKSTCQPPPELQAMLFDTDWLEEVDDDYRQLVLNISKEDFPWIEFRPEQATTI